MTIRELCDVPIGGKVTTGFGATFTKTSNFLWRCEAGDDIPGNWLIDWRNTLSPVTEPQTWQEIARSQGWFVDRNGLFAGRFFSDTRAVKITPVGKEFLVHCECDSDSHFQPSLESAIELANVWANAGGGWA